MGSQTLDLYTIGRGGIALQTTSPTHYVLTFSSAQYLFAFICIGLSSGYLMSSGAAHGPIFSFGPFIPTHIIQIQYIWWGNGRTIIVIKFLNLIVILHNIV